MKVLLWRKHDCGMNGVEELPSKYVVKFTGWRSDVHSECDSKIRVSCGVYLAVSRRRHRSARCTFLSPRLSVVLIGQTTAAKTRSDHAKLAVAVLRPCFSPCFARASRRWAAGRSLNNHLFSLLKLEQHLVEILSCPFRIFIHTAFILHIKK